MAIVPAIAHTPTHEVVRNERPEWAPLDLPPCPTEDSDNCYWDADVRGNGQGISFTVRNGNVYYVPPAECEAFVVEDGAAFCDG